MNATLRQLAPTQVQLDIEVPATDLDKARAEAIKRLSQRLRIPGFRPGHIPRKIIEQHVGSEHIEHETIEAVVPDVYAQALEEHDLDPVERPKIDLERLEDGRALKITATVAVKPQIELKPYTGIAVTSPSTDIDDREVDESIEVLRRRAAALEPVSGRGAQQGDVVTLDYAGRIDGELFEGGSATNYATEIAPQRFIPGFAEQLYGAMPGERRTVTATFPAQYRPESLAGKTAVFDVLVHDVKQPVLPALDDDFARSVSDLETFDALRNEVRRRLERGARARARESVESSLLRDLTQANDFPLPDVLVERETNSLLAEIKEQVERSGAQWDAYLKERNQTEEDVRAQVRPDAERRIKAGLIIEQIAKQEKIRVTNEDVDRELEALARSQGATGKATLEALRSSGNIDRFLSAIKRNKTLAFLVEKAKVVEAPAAEAPPAGVA
ncbi:MAG: trigger factor [Candidatus Eremiobacteraeota bacterium]|nr:trigger factor [Candidatus Eremiobacteraeota bacterium]